MKKVLWMTVISVLFQTSVVFAEPTTGDMMDMLQRMQKQMSEMQSTINNQNFKIQQLESRKVLETPQPNIPVQPSTATMSDEDFQKGIKDNIGKAVPWMKGAKYSGDFRLRQEYFDFFDKNLNNGATDRSRNRFRIRLRYGFEKDYGDDWKMGFRLVSATAGTNGVATDNTSTNVTLGNPGYSVYKNIYIDRAYAQYSPNGLKDYGAIKGASIGAGKFDNPFLRYSTPIMWDGDVTPEGLYEKATLQLHSGEENKLNLYATAGQFILNENAGTDTDAQLYGYQGALNWSTYNFGTETPVDFSLGMSFYHTINYSRTVASNTASTSYLRTNSQNGDEFEIWDFYPEVKFNVGNRPLTLWYNFVTNADDTDGDPATFGEKEDAWGFGFKYGKAKKKGQWELFYGYYQIEANAVMAAFSDSDFGGPGGAGFTNRKGHKFGLGYQLTDSITFNWTGYVVKPLNHTVTVASSANETVFRSQADLVYKF